MSEKERRKYLTIAAINPDDGKTYELLLSYEKIRRVGTRSIGQAKECGEIVHYALQHPIHIYEGLCRDEDENISECAGWRCYCCMPPHAYNKEGQKIPPWKNNVFLVFVNSDRVAYNWYWAKCDKDDPQRPEDYVVRFAKEVL